MNERLFELLKTKAASLGFSESELKSVAEALGKSLDPNDAEQNDEKLIGLINLAIPSLELSQKAANRIVAKKQKEFDEKLQQALQTAKPTDDKPVPPTNTNGAKEEPKTDELGKLTALLEKFMTETNKRFDVLDGQQVSRSRKQQLEEVVKGCEQFGARYLRDFDRITFKDDEDFGNWLNDAKSDIEAYNKERSTAGLPGKPFGGNADETNKKETLTDAQIDAIAKTF